MEAEIQPYRYFVLQVMCPSLLTDVTKPTSLLGLPIGAGKVFQENSSSGGQDALRCQKIANKLTLFYVTNSVNCWNGRGITDLNMCKENILYSKSYILLDQYIPRLKFQSLPVTLIESRKQWDACVFASSLSTIG